MECYTFAVTLIYNRQRSRTRRRVLRKLTPAPESLLWYWLRDRRFLGYKFRRQYSVGRYIVDFYCPQAKLVIELDGDSHFRRRAEAYDANRTAYLRSVGLRVVRFTNDEVVNNLEGVLESIAEDLDF